MKPATKPEPVKFRFTPVENARFRVIAAAIYRRLRDAKEPGYERLALVLEVLKDADVKALEPVVTASDVNHALLWLRAKGVRVVIARARLDPGYGYTRIALGERLPEDWDALL